MPKEPASDNAAFDPHLTDPARLRAEVRKDLSQIDPAYAEPDVGDVRLVFDPRTSKPSPVKVKAVFEEHFLGIDQGGESVQAVWDARAKRWRRYGKVDI